MCGKVGIDVWYSDYTSVWCSNYRNVWRSNCKCVWCSKDTLSETARKARHCKSRHSQYISTVLNWLHKMTEKGRQREKSRESAQEREKRGREKKGGRERETFVLSPKLSPLYWAQNSLSIGDREREKGTERHTQKERERKRERTRETYTERVRERERKEERDTHRRRERERVDARVSVSLQSSSEAAEWRDKNLGSRQGFRLNAKV